MLNWSADRYDSAGGGKGGGHCRPRAALLAEIEARLAAGRGFSVATLNLDHVVKLRSDAAFPAPTARMSHVTADGNPIVWLSWLAGHPLELTPGSELVDPVAAAAVRAGVPVALLGTTDAALRLAPPRRWPAAIRGFASR